MSKFLKVYTAKIPGRFFKPNSEGLKTIERNLLKLNMHITRIALNKIPIVHPKITHSYNFLLRCVDDSG